MNRLTAYPEPTCDLVAMEFSIATGAARGPVQRADGSDIISRQATPPISFAGAASPLRGHVALIVRMIASKEVAWPDARSHIALVQGQRGAERASRPLKDQPVRSALFLAKSEGSVAVAETGGCPQPAVSALVDLRPEALAKAAISALIEMVVHGLDCMRVRSATQAV